MPVAVAPLRTGPGLVSSAAARTVSSVSDKQNLKKIRELWLCSLKLCASRFAEKQVQRNAQNLQKDCPALSVWSAQSFKST